VHLVGSYDKNMFFFLPSSISDLISLWAAA